MEHKDKYRVHAHTFIPSVERLEDNPSLIQLASKAKDAEQAVSNANDNELKNIAAKKPSLKTVDSNLKNQRNSHGIVGDKSTNFGKSTIVGKSALDLNSSGYCTKKAMEMNPHRNGDFALPNMQRFPVKSSLHGSDYKLVTSAGIGKVTAPNQSSYNLVSSKSQMKVAGHSAGDKHPKEDGDKTASANVDKDDVKENTASTQSSYHRSFMSQSDRPPPMKLERNRGNHKLPVGIAVARQRTLTTPNKSSNTSARRTSPDLDRKHLEHAVNREREVFLRENKEISNFTSMLQANTASPAIPLLNMQGNSILQGNWEQERSLMSSLLQWQAQQQSALISTGLQNPSMWLGGTTPYHLPGSQHAASLASSHSSISGYPCIGNGLGGLVFMPQFLQEAGSGGMWSSLAALCGNVPAPLPTSYANLLSNHLGHLSSHELQLLQQQVMMSHGIPFPLSKANPLKLDERDTNIGATRHHSSLHDKVCNPTMFRSSSSPEAMRQARTMSCCSADRDTFHRSVVSPPLQTHSNQQHEAASVAQVKSKVLTSCHTKWDSELSNTHNVNKRNAVTDENRLEPVSESAPHTVSPVILDLTSSSPENDTPLQEDVTVNVCERSDQGHFQSNQNCIESANFVTPDAVQTASMKDNFVSKTNPFVQSNETCPSDLWDKTVKASARAVNHSYTRNLEPIMSSGVELLTKAAAIHMKTLNSWPSPPRKRKLSHDTSNCVIDKKKHVTSDFEATTASVPMDNCGDAPQSAIDPIDVSSFDPDVLAAVRGITLLSQSYRNPANLQQSSNVNLNSRSSQAIVPNEERPQSPLNDCNSDMQSTVSYGSVNDLAIISGDCLSSNELKDTENFEKVPLKRRLKKPFSSKKFSREGENVKVDNFKLDDTMEAREVDMKMRLADLQRRYKEKQKELAKIQRRNKKDKTDMSTPTASDFLSTGQRINAPPAIHHASPKYKFGEITALTTSQVCPPSSSLQTELSKPSPCSSSDPYREKSLFERFASEVCAFEKANEIGCIIKDDTEGEVHLDQQQAPSGSRKRKLDKPKRICLQPGETPTVPLVDPAKKNFSTLTSFNEAKQDEASKEKRRKMKKATKKIKAKSPDDAASNSWVFKSKNKVDKQSDMRRKKVNAKKLSTKSRKLSGNTSLKKNVSSSVSESRQTEPSSPEPNKSESEHFSSPRLELKEEDLVKGLQVLVPLEDKLLYLCHINPIQPPDIYEVTVEGERHRHRPIVMCLEQILKEAVPDVKPKSASDVCEGSRVAAYWSHQMHCLYTGTIAFDDSNDEEEENREEGMIQVEFDDGDSSMIPLDDIRLLPRNYPIMQPGAPFMMNFVHRRRNTSDMSNKETPKASQNRSKKAKSEKKSKLTDKSHDKRLTIQRPRKSNPDHSDRSEDGSVDISLTSTRKKRNAKKNGAKATCSGGETATSSASSADEDSDIMFSDSDDTYDGDGELQSASDSKRILLDFNEDSQSQNTKLELWSWLDKDVQKKTMKGKAKKICHKSIKRGDEIVSCGDSAVFLSAGRMHLPYIGRIESMWESWGDNMVVKVRWFYHPEETKRGRTKSHDKHPLYKSSHIDENDVQTISHKCEVVSYKEYCRRMRNNERNVFYCAGTYDPATGQVTHEHTDKRKHSKS